MARQNMKMMNKFLSSFTEEGYDNLPFKFSVYNIELYANGIQFRADNISHLDMFIAYDDIQNFSLNSYDWGEVIETWLTIKSHNDSETVIVDRRKKEDM